METANSTLTAVDYIIWFFFFLPIVTGLILSFRIVFKGSKKVALTCELHTWVETDLEDGKKELRCSSCGAKPV